LRKLGKVADYWSGLHLKLRRRRRGAIQTIDEEKATFDKGDEKKN